MEKTSKNVSDANYPKDAVQDCIKNADVVISGKVSKVRDVEYDKNYPISKHDPKWKEATIHIDNVEMGSYGGREINVLFPQSDHVSWYKTPKLNIGDEAIYVLHKGSVPQIREKESYAVLHKTDVHSKDNVNQLKRLIESEN